MAKIILNQALCLNCGQLLISSHVHDFRQCDCGNAVDGGREYLRRVGNPAAILDLSVMEDEATFADLNQVKGALDG